MPIYEYICKEQHITERLTFDDVPMIQCSCGNIATRIISRGMGFLMNPEDRGGHG